VCLAENCHEGEEPGSHAAQIAGGLVNKRRIRLSPAPGKGISRRGIIGTAAAMMATPTLAVGCEIGLRMPTTALTYNHERRSNGRVGGRLPVCDSDTPAD